MIYGEKIVEVQEFGWVKDKGNDIEIVVMDTSTDTIHMSKDKLPQLLVMLVAADIKLQEAGKGA